mmetsp:Transcript_3702/g.10941  ORF Transcript_3702/g.10941 Transcript_3702/m.10941 type:complete len:443 (+) Transcript_3702:131-1459(+)
MRRRTPPPAGSGAAQPRARAQAAPRRSSRSARARTLPSRVDRSRKRLERRVAKREVGRLVVGVALSVWELGAGAVHVRAARLVRLLERGEQAVLAEPDQRLSQRGERRAQHVAAVPDGRAGPVGARQQGPELLAARGHRHIRAEERGAQLGCAGRVRVGDLERDRAALEAGLEQAVERVGRRRREQVCQVLLLQRAQLLASQHAEAAVVVRRVLRLEESGARLRARGAPVRAEIGEQRLPGLPVDALLLRAEEEGVHEVVEQKRVQVVVERQRRAHGRVRHGRDGARRGRRVGLSYCREERHDQRARVHKGQVALQLAKERLVDETRLAVAQLGGAGEGRGQRRAPRRKVDAEKLAQRIHRVALWLVLALAAHDLVDLERVQAAQDARQRGVLALTDEPPQRLDHVRAAVEVEEELLPLRMARLEQMRHQVVKVALALLILE